MYRLLTQSPWDERSALWTDLSTAESFCQAWNRPRLRAVLADSSYLDTVDDPPPLDLLVDGESFYLAHFNANRAVYTRQPPPAELT